MRYYWPSQMMFSTNSSLVGPRSPAMLTMFAFLVFVVACSSSGQRLDNPLGNELRVGEYLREDYIQALRSTLSPIGSDTS